MNSARYITLGLVAVILGGCTYPTFEFATSSAGGTGGAGATSTVTGNMVDDPMRGATNGVVTGGGVTGSTVTSGASSAASGGDDCKVSHEGGGACEYRPGSECGCDAPDKCSVTREDTGEAQCTKAGKLVAYQKCSSDNDCVAGTWCDHFAHTCGKVCASSADCKGGVCFPPLNAALSQSIPGLGVCTANCDPVSAQPCGTNTNCFFDTTPSIQGFDCIASANKTEGQSCATSSDCGKGLFCSANTKICVRWCTSSSNCSAQKPTCTNFSPPFKPGATVFGFCSL